MNPYEALNPFNYPSKRDHRAVQDRGRAQPSDAAISRATYRIVNAVYGKLWR